MIQSIEVTEQDKNSYLICGNCNVKVYPFYTPKFCSCGNISIDEEKSTDKVLYLRRNDLVDYRVTSDYKPTFKEKIMDMFKGKNKV